MDTSKPNPKMLTFTGGDYEDFNAALSLTWIAANMQTTDCGDDGFHLRKVCDMVSIHLCNIRNRHSSRGMDLQP